MSLREQIKAAAADIPYEDVEVPEWGGAKVRVRSLTGAERDAFEAKIVKLRRGGQDVELALQNHRAHLLVKSLRDPDTDERIYSDSDADVAELGSAAGIVLDRLFDLCQRISGMDEGADARAEGNSDAGPSDSSITG